MIKVENIEVWGFKHAIRGMRNPLNSWDKSDSVSCEDINGCDICQNYLKCRCNGEDFCAADFTSVGENDLALMKKLYKAGSEHRKYLRQIFVSMDITAPLYFLKEFDTYKIGVTTDSCSTMHKIADKEFELSDFSCEHIGGTSNYDPLFMYTFSLVVDALNEARHCYLDTNDKCYWWQMIQLLPSSYNQRRTVTMSYENAVNIINQRTGHKLDEWNDFVSELKKLPYIKEIMEG